MKNDIRILGVLVSDREHVSAKVQETLTKYGCSIKTRLGLSELGDAACPNCGLIILELTGDPAECLRLENDLWAIDGVRLQKMVF